jgi:transcriptional regulator with XRE-family HTH domain/tetratricopeptide (TPR) repeat protein
MSCVYRTSDGPSTFGELVVRHRLAAGQTQEQLAEASGMSVRALRDLERGRSQVAQRRSTEVLANALGLAGDDRARFLDVAREGRRRTPSPPVPLSARVPTPPPALSDLVGREREMALLEEVSASGATIVVTGHPGVGKTAFAVSAAFHLRTTFPDGYIAVDLRGLDDDPVTPLAALDRLLRGLNVASADIPASEGDRVSLYRTTLAGRRVLVLLDNAADEVQVRPLLASAPGCLTLVTCRRALVTLEGVRWLWLDPLSGGDAVELLARIAGADRVRAEPFAAARLVALCGNLPLAVRVVGNRLATRPNWSVAHLVELLADERGRLGSLSAGDLHVRSAFELSYRRLTPDARVVFHRLVAVPGTHFGAELAAVAAAVDEVAAQGYLDEFADANLLQTTSAEGRFQFHDLIRLFAVERWEAEATATEREKTQHAVLTYLLRTAGAAGTRFRPDAEPDATGRFASETEAWDWLVREESSWLAALRNAVRLGWHSDVLRLVDEIDAYADSWWFGLPWAVATEEGDRSAEVWAEAFIGTALMFLGRLDEALDHAGRAAKLAAEFDFWDVQQPVRNHLGAVLADLGRYEEALAVYRETLAAGDLHGGTGSSATRRMISVYVKEGIGECLVGLGRWRRAAETFSETQRARAELGSTGDVARAALHQGRTWLRTAEYGRARESLRYALAAYGDHVSIGRARMLAGLARLPED